MITSQSTHRHENGVRHTKHIRQPENTCNAVQQYKRARTGSRDRRNVRLDRNKQNGTRLRGRPRQNRFAANADPAKSATHDAISFYKVFYNRLAIKMPVNTGLPAVVNKATTHTPSVIRSTSADRLSINGSAANSTSNAANTQSAENRSARANYETHDEAPR